MNKFIRYLFPSILAAGVLFYLLIVHGLSINNPNYVYSDSLVKLSMWLMITGVVGSLIMTVKRFGISRLKILLAVWAIAAFSLFKLNIGEDLSSLGWILIAYPAVIIGSILVIVYTFKNV